VPALVDGIGGVGVDDGADGFGVGMAGGGLTPPTPSPVEPIGIPPRPVGDVDPIPVGDEAEAAGPPAGPVAMPAQVPEAAPATPPPSKSEPRAGFETPVVAPPLKLPTLELMPAQVAVLLVVGGLTGDVLEVVGLTPTDPNPTVPSGIPVRGTAGPGPMPSGDVVPSGKVVPSGEGPLPPTWADANPQVKKYATVAAIRTRVMPISFSAMVALTETAMICSRGQADRLAKGRAE
jgi:hypothetical protein